MIDSKVGSNFRITGIGEVLWNVFPGGKRFGGVPSNLACQAQALGANETFVHNDKIVLEATDMLGYITASSADVDVVVSYLEQTL